MLKRLTALLLLTLWTAVLVAQEPAATDPDHQRKMAEGTALFKKEVRGTLTGRCLRCHGGEDDIEGEFDLTSRESMLKGSYEGAVVIPGDSQRSRLVKMITHEIEPHMPEDGAKLSPLAISGIARWIDLGAPYDKPLVDKDADPLAWTRRKIDPVRREFWSFQPLSRVAPPQVDDQGWCRQDVDRFVWRKLAEHKMQPNPLADSRTLMRRAYFDLLGLPPTAAEVEAFVNRTDAHAYEELIDTLLESPHYGERWGRHWLDVARFGESHGFEQDYDRPNAYHYRDFVIKALNQDMPYDQFVRWQIAGDEFAPDDPLAMMATGFLGAGVFPTQLTEKEFEPARYDELDDMVATIGTSMLGLTTGCARCHDHKFDPIPAADYYRLVANFATTIRSETPLPIDSEEHAAALAKWNAEHQTYVDKVAAFKRDQLPARFEKWLASNPARDIESPAWLILDAVEYTSQGGATMTKQPDGSLLVTGTNPDFDKYTITAHTQATGITSIRLEALADKSMVRNGPGRAKNGNMGLGNFSVTAAPLNGGAEPVAVTLTRPRVTFEQNKSNLSIAASLDNDLKTGWAVDPQFGKNHAAVFDIENSIGFDGGTKLTFTLEFNVNNKHNIGRPRLAISTRPAPVAIEDEGQDQKMVELFRLLEGGFDTLNAAQQAQVRQWYGRIDTELQALEAAVAKHAASKPQPKTATVMVSTEGLKPMSHHADGRGFPHFYKETYFLNRGDANQKQGVADHGVLQVLNTSPDGEQRWLETPPEGCRTSYRRRSLANWLTDTEYGAGQLLARVIVNRLWHHHFGRGIVSTPNDFGFQGQRPSHPELLDWLAQQLIADGWSLKKMHKRMMLTATYMQTADYDETDGALDPENQWQWRHTPQRLEAEVIRDAMLAVSGQLDRTMFGKGTLDERMKRRSIYFMIKRSKLIPSMQIFDAPEPLVSAGDRPTTTIAPQALHFMNNNQVRECASAFAGQLDAASTELAIRTAYLTALAREPTAGELADSVMFVEQQAKSYEADRIGNAPRLALTDFCQVLLSLNEFIYVD